jgi:ubiquinone/menaquinone biosynthesis C-methylase UbiE
MIPVPHFRRSVPAMGRLYNRICRFYGSIEKSLDPKIEAIVARKIATIPDVSSQCALEYACGTGLLSFKLSRHFGSVTARDGSLGMLSRARARAAREGAHIDFQEGNILDITDHAGSFDWTFVEFALHLFPPDVEMKILRRLADVARQGVVVIDHRRRWSLPAAIVEWLEGGYYDKFIRLDFAPVARDMGCRTFTEEEIEECMVLSFIK